MCSIAWQSWTRSGALICAREIDVANVGASIITSGLGAHNNYYEYNKDHGGNTVIANYSDPCISSSSRRRHRRRHRRRCRRLTSQA